MAVAEQQESNPLTLGLERLPVPPTALVIFGATGDLALRMLYPSLYFLHAEGRLAAGLRIIGAARGDLEPDVFAARAEEAVRERADGFFDEAAWASFRALCRSVPNGFSITTRTSADLWRCRPAALSCSTITGKNSGAVER